MTDQTKLAIRTEAMTSPLYDAFLAASKADFDAWERSNENQDDALAESLREASRAAEVAVNVARQALIDSDDARPWSLADEEGGEFERAFLRPSEVEERLRAGIQKNYDEDDLPEAIRVSGCAHCLDTNESIEVVVDVPASEGEPR